LGRDVKTKGTILVVDNILETARRIKNILTAEGYLVSTASNSDLAISIANDVNPSLIFVSLTMPDGLEICKRIHGAPAFSKTPIIVLTSEEKGFKTGYGSEYGIVDSLNKSSSPEDLILKTETVLSIKGITETEMPRYEFEETSDILKQARPGARAMIQEEEEPFPVKDIKSGIRSEEEFIPIRDEVEGLIEKSFEPESEMALTEDMLEQKKKKRLFVPVTGIAIILIFTGIYIIWQKTGIKIPIGPLQKITKVKPAQEQAIPTQPLKAQVPEPKTPPETQPTPPVEKVIIEPEKKGPFYSAQVGAFKEIDNAEALVKRLKDKGYDAFIQSITKGNQKINKVLVGKFENKKDAKEMISTIRVKEGIKATIVSSE
jgi:CheY-like chemotaxis protein